jgi:hypothetical protein
MLTFFKCCNIFRKMLEEVKKWRKMLSNISTNVDKRYVGKLLKNVDEEEKCWQHFRKMLTKKCRQHS